ncbi:hypothetical protein [Pseudolysinimonas sp.]
MDENDVLSSDRRDIGADLIQLGDSATTRPAEALAARLREIARAEVAVATRPTTGAPRSGRAFR